MTILIIEENKKIAVALKKALQKERYGTDIAATGMEGSRKAMTGMYDLVLLSLNLPDIDGTTVARELRVKEVETPIIVVTERTSMEEKVSLLEHVDDYVTKPFNLDELLARVRAVLRRKKTRDAPVIKMADLVLDDGKHELTRAGIVVPLTPKEYRLLSVLMRRKGEALSRRQLLNVAWNPQFEETNHELSVHMRYLRRKIDDKRKKPLIRTIRGVGYTMRED